MISLTVNGTRHTVEADPDKPLLWILRDGLHLKGTKYGCGVGVCGACVVLIDGEPNHACKVPLCHVGSREVTTIEGLTEGHPLIRAWIAEQVPQCGYCQPAQILAAVALRRHSPNPTDAEIDAALAGVLCRCGTYQRIRRAIHAAARSDFSNPAYSSPELLDHLPDDAGIALNEWIWIGRDDRVTLMINHAEMGQGALTGLVVLFAEELDLDPAGVRTVFAPVDKRYENGLWGGQFTGGSSSIRGEWTRLRRVAAKTRARLIAAAAEQWRVPADACTTESGRVVHGASGRTLSYAALAAVAAGLKAPRSVRLKSPAEFRLIGRALPRLDIPAMALGRTRYGIDVDVPGMHVAVVARCPVFGGRLTGFDDGAAHRVPGVRAVLAIESGVAVVADDFWSAQRGREALDIEWAAGPYADVDDETLERRLQRALRTEGKLARREGDAKRRLERAASRIEATYHTPYLAHACIEPMNCVAWVRDDVCEVWVGTQDQSGTRTTAAKAARLPEAQVRVHTQFLGGGFGRRLETDFVVDAVELSRRLGAPVQVIWTRADDLQHDFYRPAHAVRLQACLDARGLPAAWFMRIAGPSGALDGVDVPYAIPHLREERVEVPTPIPVGAWRSVGASNNAFAIECFIDELAHAAGWDPLDYRRALLGDAPRHRAVLDAAAERANWGTPMPEGCGRGIAVYRSFEAIVAQVAEVCVVDDAVRVERVVCAIDCGTVVLPDAVRAQVEGGIAFGLSAALHEAVRIRGGQVRQESFQDYPILTLPEMPQVEVYIVPSEAAPGGVGEPAVPVIAPALVNAVFAATGRRERRLPLRLV